MCEQEFTLAELEYQIDEMLFRMNSLARLHKIDNNPVDSNALDASGSEAWTHEVTSNFQYYKFCL